MAFPHAQLLAHVEMNFNVLNNHGPESTGPWHRKLVDEPY